MKYWTVPPMWRGRTVAVLASGPSMTQADADRVRHLPRIAVNSTYRLAPDADVIYAADAAWWRLNPRALESAGLKVSVEIVPRCPPAVPAAVNVIRNGGRKGMDNDPGKLRTLGNSGAQAIQVAAHAGAARIILLGFDMHGGHWHEAHAKPLTNPREATFARWIVDFRELARALALRGIDVINCTPESRLDCFPRASLDDALQDDEKAAA